MGKKSRRENIIHAAISLFHVKGYNSVSIQDILEATGIPKGSFYYYFSCKEDLVRQSVVYYMTKVVTLMTMYPVNVAGLRDFLFSQFNVMEESGYREGYYISIIASELAGYNEGIRSELRIAEYRVSQYVKRSLINSYGFNNAEADEYALFILQSFHGAMRKARLERSSDSIKAFEKFVFEELLTKSLPDISDSKTASGSYLKAMRFDKVFP